MLLLANILTSHQKSIVFVVGKISISSPRRLIWIPFIQWAKKLLAGISIMSMSFATLVFFFIFNGNTKWTLWKFIYWFVDSCIVNSAVFKSLYVSSANAFFASVPFSWPWYSGFANPPQVSYQLSKRVIYIVKSFI